MEGARSNLPALGSAAFLLGVNYWSRRKAMSWRKESVTATRSSTPVRPSRRSFMIGRRQVSPGNGRRVCPSSSSRYSKEAP